MQKYSSDWRGAILIEIVRWECDLFSSIIESILQFSSIKQKYQQKKANKGSNTVKYINEQ